jgi:hypothetical protein
MQWALWVHYFREGGSLFSTRGFITFERGVLAFHWPADDPKKHEKTWIVYAAGTPGSVFWRKGFIVFDKGVRYFREGGFIIFEKGVHYFRQGVSLLSRGGFLLSTGPLMTQKNMKKHGLYMQLALQVQYFGERGSLFSTRGFGTFEKGVSLFSRRGFIIFDKGFHYFREGGSCFPLAR